MRGRSWLRRHYPRRFAVVCDSGTSAQQGGRRTQTRGRTLVLVRYGNVLVADKCSIGGAARAVGRCWRRRKRNNGAHEGGDTHHRRKSSGRRARVLATTRHLHL